MVEEDRKSAEALFQCVMNDLGHEGWLLRWDGAGPYCWRKKKLIDISPMDSLGECKQMLLHEVAHIDIVEPQGDQHTECFWEHLEGLIGKYLDSGLSKWQKVLRGW